MKSASALKIGQVLNIPAPTADDATPQVTKMVDVNETPTKTAKRTSDQRGNGTKRRAKPPANTYTVKKGDTFYSIAKTMYGKSSRWKDIFKANKRVVKNKPTNLKPGMVLRLPT